MSFSQEELKQYNRHFILEDIGETGQLKLKQAKVLIIGAGGLGCPVLQYLTAAGIGNIGILDDDIIEQSNLQRQILYTYNDIGKHKAAVAASKLALLNPFVNLKAHTERLTNKNAISLFDKYDIIVDGSDNFSTRYLVNDAAVITNKPVVFGSIYKFEGQVSVFNYRNGPNYRCLFPTPPDSKLVGNCSAIGVLGVLPGIIGALQANEVIKIICQIGNILSGKLWTINTLTMDQHLLNFKKNSAILINKLEDNYFNFCGAQENLKEIKYCELIKHMSEYNLLDVRTINERNKYHIGGIHIPLNELPEKFNTIPQSKNLIVYCQSGIRSKEAITFLKKAGFTCALFNLEGGLN
ncbi:molybdopterin-synthase adenylyltransferase MoeB [Arachidicoccus soli]|uniref:Molybdopterin-synthase adenylyltransferase n=1 Tax=Arachidicoccus soli TaxID=2341117 RepID=A0A386HQ59_9BACT|nr:molybdopterin-synthase adenylyltransferase MoeB [Arachidicoccus soli]AYD47706.1 molybdopterin-synthase adenylyltransferase MoeB [Arachidicoccus soli]